MVEEMREPACSIHSSVRHAKLASHGAFAGFQDEFFLVTVVTFYSLRKPRYHSYAPRCVLIRRKGSITWVHTHVIVVLPIKSAVSMEKARQ